jgi:hypothetical protein
MAGLTYFLVLKSLFPHSFREQATETMLDKRNKQSYLELGWLHHPDSNHLYQDPIQIQGSYEICSVTSWLLSPATVQ